MAFDYTNYLETATQANNGDFVFTNRAGTVDSGVQTANTAGQWCEEVSSTTSSGTGPSTSPPGRAGFIYTEASTPAASSTWAMRRDTTFDSTSVAVTLNLVYNLNADVGSYVYIEYATVASPNETTDWSILESIPCTLTDSWISDSFDFSAISTTTLHIRVRCDTLNAYTNDIAFSTWNEVGVDLAGREQAAFRFYDDGTESGSTALDSQNTDITIAAETPFQTRVGMQATGDPPAESATLQYKETGDAASEWRDVQ